MVKNIGYVMHGAYDRYRELQVSDKLAPDQKDFYNRILSTQGQVEEMELMRSVGFLSQCLYQYYGVKPIILIDEYDAPLLSAYMNGYFDEAIELIRGIFAGALKTNDYLGRAILTGITRISVEMPPRIRSAAGRVFQLNHFVMENTKESLFSDLNNLKTAGMLDNAYADCLGFTEEEVMDALEEFGLSDRKGSVRKWYDGYTIGNKTDIYNPWAVTNYLDSDGQLQSYWSNSGGNDLIKQLLMDGGKSIKQKFEELLQDKAIEVEVRGNVAFQELSRANNETAVWTLLIATGYVTTVEYLDMTGVTKQVQIRITNNEVKSAMSALVREWFDDYTQYYGEFVSSFLKNDLEGMNRLLTEVLQNCMSYHDGGRNMGEERIKDRKDRRTPENFYHGLVLGMLVDLQGRYDLTSNRESGNGRYDIMLEPLKGAGRMTHSDPQGQSATASSTAGESTPRGKEVPAPAYIIEFKVQNEVTEKSLEETADNALKQIEEKGYETALLAKGIAKERIFKYGMAFSGKEALVKLGKK